MKTYRLIPHPASPPDKVRGVHVEVIETVDDLLLTFIVEGVEALRVPDWAVSERADGLWSTTCFELFLQAEGSDAYWEFNFSPSTQWAAYRFEGYREDMRDFPMTVDPFVERGDEKSGYLVEVDFDLSDMPNIPLRMGLSAVIEEASGRKSWWALAHPPGAPDFHHEDCFALELAAARTP